MNDRSIEAERFYRERVPSQFNRTFEAEERAARAGDETAQRLLAGMRTVNATIRVRVEGDGIYHLNVEGGRMSCDEADRHPPFLQLSHDLDSFAGLARESGDSVLGFLGALAGMQGDMKLTSQRVQNLRALSGSLRFDLTGSGGFSLTAGFGPAPLPATPSCSIRIDADSYHAMRRGELAPQDAFLGGRIEVEGDMQMAMQLALAALSPE